MIANIKETQLAELRGQPVKFTSMRSVKVYQAAWRVLPGDRRRIQPSRRITPPGTLSNTQRIPVRIEVLGKPESALLRVPACRVQVTIDTREAKQ